MAEAAAVANKAECEEMATKQFKNSLKMVAKEIKNFNLALEEFLEEQRRQARELLVLVTRYNVINSGPPFSQVPSNVIKEEILEELMAKIQEKTDTIHHALQATRSRYESLSKHKHLLTTHSDQLEWSPQPTFALKRDTNLLRSLSQCLEEMADILFQYDISLTCIGQYFESLNVRDCGTYQNLINSLSLSKELTDFVNEFQINCIMVYS